MRLLAEDDKCIITKKENQKKSFELADQNLFISMYRDTIYKNKLRVIPQEYMANARDAHREVGKDDVPIEVTLPTIMDPILIIRDFGIGINEERSNIFRHYGASTKRDSDNENGGFGIGCKCAWSYTESFTVDTIFEENGKKIHRVYSLWIEHQMDPGNIRVVSEEEVEPDAPTGTCLKIPIMDSDVDDVCESVATTGLFWKVRPIITNADECDFNWPEPIITRKGNGWTNYMSTDLFGINGSFAIIDGVCYKLDLELLKRGRSQYEETGEDNNVEEVRYAISERSHSILSNSKFSFEFIVNEVEVAPNREDISYNAKSIKALRDKIEASLDEMVNGIKADLANLVGDDSDFLDMLKSVHALNLGSHDKGIGLNWKKKDGEEIDIVAAYKNINNAECMIIKNDGGRATYYQSFPWDIDHKKAAFIRYDSSTGMKNSAKRVEEDDAYFKGLNCDTVVIFNGQSYRKLASQYALFITHNKLTKPKDTRPVKDRNITGVFLGDRPIKTIADIDDDALFLTRRYQECSLFYHDSNQRTVELSSSMRNVLKKLYPGRPIYQADTRGERALRVAEYNCELVDHSIKDVVAKFIENNQDTIKYYDCYDYSFYDLNDFIFYIDAILEWSEKNDKILHTALAFAYRMYKKYHGKHNSHDIECILRLARALDIKYSTISIDSQLDTAIRIVNERFPLTEVISRLYKRKSLVTNIIRSYKDFDPTPPKRRFKNTIRQYKGCK